MQTLTRSKKGRRAVRNQAPDRPRSEEGHSDERLLVLLLFVLLPPLLWPSLLTRIPDWFKLAAIVLCIGVGLVAIIVLAALTKSFHSSGRQHSALSVVPRESGIGLAPAPAAEQEHLPSRTTHPR